MSTSALKFVQITHNQGVQFLHDIALQAALDFFGSQPLTGSALNVGLCPWIAAHTNAPVTRMGWVVSVISGIGQQLLNEVLV
jgi:hypothetical protein